MQTQKSSWINKYSEFFGSCAKSSRWDFHIWKNRTSCFSSYWLSNKLEYGFGYVCAGAPMGLSWISWCYCRYSLSSSIACSLVLLDITHIHYYAVSNCEQGRNWAKTEEKSNIFFLLPLSKGIWIKQTMFGAFRPSIKISLLSDKYCIHSSFGYRNPSCHYFLEFTQKKLSHSKWYWLLIPPRDKWTFQNCSAYYNYCDSWSVYGAESKND